MGSVMRALPIGDYGSIVVKFPIFYPHLEFIFIVRPRRLR